LKLHTCSTKHKDHELPLAKGSGSELIGAELKYCDAFSGISNTLSKEEFFWEEVVELEEVELGRLIK
jgi:hypothetical protein